jgi:hypothetical protein
LVDTLSIVTTMDEALETFSTVLTPDRIVEVHKRRSICQRGSWLVDDVRFQVDRSAFRSVGVESTSIEALRSLVNELAVERLGEPRNYMQFLYRRA